MTPVTLPNEHRLRGGALSRVGETEDVDENDAADQEQREPHGKRDDSLNGMHPCQPRLLSIRSLLHPSVVSRLFGGGFRINGLGGLEHPDAPRVDGVAQRSRIDRIPLDARDRPRVAVQLSGELAGLFRR